MVLYICIFCFLRKERCTWKKSNADEAGRESTLTSQRDTTPAGGKTACSGHIISQRLLVELLLIGIRFKAALSQNQPYVLKEKIMAQKNAASAEQTRTLKATLAALDKRLAELEKLVVSTYEDKVKGAIPEALCIQLLNRYEAERRDKLEQRTQLEAVQEDEQTTDSWLDLIRDYSQLQDLDRPTLVRWIWC